MQKITTEPNDFFVFCWKGIQVVIDCHDDSLIEDCARLLAIHPQKTTQSQYQLIPDIRMTHNNVSFSVEFTDWPVKLFTQKQDLLLYCTLVIGAAFLRKTQTLVLHAGSFIFKGQAIVFGGASRSGKSTLAYEALKAGLPILGDDMITLNPLNHQVEAFPKPVKLRLSQAQNVLIKNEHFSRYEYVHGSLGGEERVLLSRDSPGMLPLEKSYPIGALILLKRNREQGTFIEKLTGLKAISAGLNQLINIQGGSGLDILQPLQSLLKDQRIYQLDIGDNDSENSLKLLINNLKKSTLEKA